MKAIFISFNQAYYEMILSIMDRNNIRSRVNKIIYIANRFLNHQMDIKNPIGTFTNGTNDRKCKRNTRNKHSIHNIDVYIFRTCLIQQPDLFSQISKICR